MSGQQPSSAPRALGILGGMGPLAGATFALRMVQLTEAAVDQDHIPTILCNDPRIPDRSSAMLQGGESPLPAMQRGIRLLEAAGAGCIAVPCNTAHLWFDDVCAAVDLPMIHLVDAAIDDAAAIVGPRGRVGLLGTDATLASGLYINRAGPKTGHLQWLLPTAREMNEWVMPGIEAVKAGDCDTGRIRLAAAAEALKGRGAMAVILGCTEIPVVLDGAHASLPVIDATAALARRAVAWSRAQREASPGLAP